LKLYEGYSIPYRGFASKLEHHWFVRLKQLGWELIYIGDECRYADFECDGVKIEIKPYGEQFIQQACGRGSNFLIASGEYGFSRWWIVREKATAYPIVGHPSSKETVRGFMIRCGVTF
jgi:hypothetical protein